MTELTILMPCLNEAESVEFCVKEALGFLESRGIQGQVLICDNGSADGSRELALRAGAEVVTEPQTGYGCAIRRGIRAAKGKYIILSDCDGSYDLSNLDAMLGLLRRGCRWWWATASSAASPQGLCPGATGISAFLCSAFWAGFALGSNLGIFTAACGAFPGKRPSAFPLAAGAWNLPRSSSAALPRQGCRQKKSLPNCEKLFAPGPATCVPSPTDCAI